MQVTFIYFCAFEIGSELFYLYKQKLMIANTFIMIIIWTALII